MTAIPDITDPPLPFKEESELRRTTRSFLRSPGAVVGIVLLVAVILLAAFAPLISPQNPYDLAQLDILDGRLPPGYQSFSGMTRSEERRVRHGYDSTYSTRWPPLH